MISAQCQVSQPSNHPNMNSLLKLLDIAWEEENQTIINFLFETYSNRNMFPAESYLKNHDNYLLLSSSLLDYSLYTLVVKVLNDGNLKVMKWLMKKDIHIPSTCFTTQIPSKESISIYFYLAKVNPNLLEPMSSIIDNLSMINCTLEKETFSFLPGFQNSKCQTKMGHLLEFLCKNDSQSNYDVRRLFEFACKIGELSLVKFTLKILRRNKINYKLDAAYCAFHPKIIAYLEQKCSTKLLTNNHNALINAFYRGNFEEIHHILNLGDQLNWIIDDSSTTENLDYISVEYYALAVAKKGDIDTFPILEEIFPISKKLLVIMFYQAVLSNNMKMMKLIRQKCSLSRIENGVPRAHLSAIDYNLNITNIGFSCRKKEICSKYIPFLIACKTGNMKIMKYLWKKRKWQNDTRYVDHMLKIAYNFGVVEIFQFIEKYIQKEIKPLITNLCPPKRLSVIKFLVENKYLVLTKDFIVTCCHNYSSIETIFWLVSYYLENKIPIPNELLTIAIEYEYVSLFDLLICSSKKKLSTNYITSLIQLAYENFPCSGIINYLVTKYPNIAKIAFVQSGLSIDVLDNKNPKITQLLLDYYQPEKETIAGLLKDMIIDMTEIDGSIYTLEILLGIPAYRRIAKSKILSEIDNCPRLLHWLLHSNCPKIITVILKEFAKDETSLISTIFGGAQNDEETLELLFYIDKPCQEIIQNWCSPFSIIIRFFPSVIIVSSPVEIVNYTYHPNGFYYYGTLTERVILSLKSSKRAKA